MTVLRTFRDGSPELTPWVLMCAFLTRSTAWHLSDRAEPAQADGTITTQDLAALLLGAAGQARPCFLCEVIDPAKQMTALALTLTAAL